MSCQLGMVEWKFFQHIIIYYILLPLVSTHPWTGYRALIQRFNKREQSSWRKRGTVNIREDLHRSFSACDFTEIWFVTAVWVIRPKLWSSTIQCFPKNIHYTFLNLFHLGCWVFKTSPLFLESPVILAEPNGISDTLFLHPRAHAFLELPICHCRQYSVCICFLNGASHSLSLYHNMHSNHDMQLQYVYM